MFITQNAQKWLKTPKIAYLPRKGTYGHVRHVWCLLTGSKDWNRGLHRDGKQLFYMRKTGKGKYWIFSFVNL